MGLNSKLLPTNILKAMQPEARHELGKPGLLPDERQAKADQKAEKELQTQICQWLEIQGIFAGRQRMDRKSNLRSGWPDIVFVTNGYPIALEVKVGNNRQTPEQVEAERRMSQDGWFYRVVRSLEEVINIFKEAQQS